jgi:hypothetical protein
VEYALLYGMLHFPSDYYSGIMCAPPQKGAVSRLKRPTASTSLMPKGVGIVGEHTSFEMALHPEIFQRNEMLILRSTIHVSTKTCEVKFLRHLSGISWVISGVRMRILSSKSSPTKRQSRYCNCYVRAFPYTKVQQNSRG